MNNQWPGKACLKHSLLDWKEVDELSRSQIVTLKRGKNVKYAPYAFTEQSKCDAQFRVVFDTIRQYIVPPANTQRKPIGFQQIPKDPKDR